MRDQAYEAAGHAENRRRRVRPAVGHVGSDRTVRGRCRMNYVLVVVTALTFIYLTYVILRPEHF